MRIGTSPFVFPASSICTVTKKERLGVEALLAERTRFELVVGLLLRQFSKLVVSATHPPLRGERVYCRRYHSTVLLCDCKVKNKISYAQNYVEKIFRKKFGTWFCADVVPLAVFLLCSLLYEYIVITKNIRHYD